MRKGHKEEGCERQDRRPEISSWGMKRGYQVAKEKDWWEGKGLWAEELTQVLRLELEMVHMAGASPAIWRKVGSSGR